MPCPLRQGSNALAAKSRLSRGGWSTHIPSKELPLGDPCGNGNLVSQSCLPRRPLGGLLISISRDIQVHLPAAIRPARRLSFLPLLLLVIPASCILHSAFCILHTVSVCRSQPSSTAYNLIIFGSCHPLASAFPSCLLSYILLHCDRHNNAQTLSNFYIARS